VSASANIRIARRFLDDVLIGQSGRAVDELIASGAVIDLPTGRFTGPDGVKGASARIRSVFPDLRVEVGDAIAAGNEVVVTWRLCGTQQRELFGVPPTGRRECMAALSQFRIEDNKIVEHQLTEGEASPEGSGPDRFATTANVALRGPQIT
jgi:predicted ester cyclase